MSLTEYNKKRSFSKTPEPEGLREKAANTKALQFVVQKHDASRLHYDFRLELDGTLKSWAVPKGPSMNPEDKRLAMMVEDHPISYGSFEGEIPKGEYGAGEVIVWDRGVYSSTETTDPEKSRKKLKEGLYKGELKFVLLGEKLKGSFALIKMKGSEENAWLLIKEKDEYATKKDVLADTSSVLSSRLLSRDSTGKTKPEKKTVLKKKKGKDKMPHEIQPMLAKLIDAPFNGTDWLFEIKWDGYRAIAEIEKGKVALYSRNGNSFAKAYPPIVEALTKTIQNDCVLDGEIVALDGEKVSFNALQHYKEKKAPLQYVVFDLLYVDGEDMREKPVSERKERLRTLIPKSGPILFSDHIEEAGVSFFETIKKQGLEGIMAKDKNSPYREGTRSGEWLKIKAVQEQEAIIVGYTEPRGSRKLIGALVLAVYDGKKLTYIGHSGGGFSSTEIKDLHTKLQKIEVKKSPLNEKVPVNSPITWVRPKYVCQLRFSEWTKDGRMRHPIYLGLRTDKEPTEVTHEERVEKKNTPEKEIIDQPKLTHLDKVYWPEEGYTKGDLLAYYDTMAEILLPYLKDRPQNLNRHPNGIKGMNFFQKNFEMELPSFVETKEIWSESNNDYLRYIVCQNKETLLYLANLGCIELNPWNSRITNLEKPDYMILDLDPNDRDFDDLIIVAKTVKDVLSSACEEFYLKTSGKSGLHIVLPIGSRYDYETVKNFAELIMRIVHARLPDITSLERSPKKRRGKIYLDYLQNRFGQTLACAYSVRPYPGATVSTPLLWTELKKGFRPSRFTIKTMAKRLKDKGDLWKPVRESKGVDIHKAISCLEKNLK
jgi:bifunctional non-homologous end joining protein LigD